MSSLLNTTTTIGPSHIETPSLTPLISNAICIHDDNEREQQTTTTPNIHTIPTTTYKAKNTMQFLSKLTLPNPIPTHPQSKTERNTKHQLHDDR